MTHTHLLAIDQGTTSSRAIVFSLAGEPLVTQQKELHLFYPHNGWVEQDATAIWDDTLWAVRECLQAYPDVAGFGITNQRETTVLWDRRTGKPLYNAIVWQDRRTAAYCQSLKQQGVEPKVSQKTGLLLDPYFSATKLVWLLDNIDGARARAQRGELAFGTIDTWLLWNLTGGRVHATDATNAARTMLFNIQTGTWDDELLEIFDIPKSLLPEVRDNAADFGTTDPELFGKTYKIAGMAGDQQAALIGQVCFAPGMIKSTYGTGCFALMNIGHEFRVSQNRLLTTIGYQLNGVTTYALEGSIFVAGAAIQWLRDNLNFFSKSSESEALALSVSNTDGVYFVPAFTGLGAPYWEPQARGCLTGLTRETTKAHIVRAALEAQAFQTLDLMGAMVKDSGVDPAVIRADGGLVANRFMCQFLADMLNKPIEIPRCHETTALGAAYLAALQLGLCPSPQDLAQHWVRDAVYTPNMTPAERARHAAGWQKAVAATRLMAQSN